MACCISFAGRDLHQDNPSSKPLTLILPEKSEMRNATLGVTLATLPVLLPLSLRDVSCGTHRYRVPTTVVAPAVPCSIPFPVPFTFKPSLTSSRSFYPLLLPANPSAADNICSLLPRPHYGLEKRKSSPGVRHAKVTTMDRLHRPCCTCHHLPDWLHLRPYVNEWHRRRYR